MSKVLIEIHAVLTVLECASGGPSIFCARIPDFHLRKIEYSGQDPLIPTFLFKTNITLL